MDLEEKMLSYSIIRDADEDDTRGHDSGDEAPPDEFDEDNVAFDEIAELRARRRELEREAEEYLSHGRDPLWQRGAGTGPQAGVKSVIADKRWADLQEDKRQDREALQRREMWRRGTHGAPMQGGSYSFASQARRAGARASSRDEDDDDGSDADAAPRAVAMSRAPRPVRGGEGEDGDAGEDEFLASYRAARLATLRVTASLPQYGEVRELADGEEYVHAVDSADARSVVCVVFHEPFIPECAAFLKALPALAAAHQHIAFMTLQSSRASSSMDVIGLPAMIVHQGGATREVLVRMQDEVSHAPTPAALRRLLVAHRILNPDLAAAADAAEAAAGVDAATRAGGCGARASFDASDIDD